MTTQPALPSPLLVGLVAMVLHDHQRIARLHEIVGDCCDAVGLKVPAPERPAVTLAYSASRADCPGSVLPLTRGRATGRAS